MSELDDGIPAGFERRWTPTRRRRCHHLPRGSPTLASVEQVLDLAALFAPEAYGDMARDHRSQPVADVPPDPRNASGAGAAMSAADYVRGMAAS